MIPADRTGKNHRPRQGRHQRGQGPHGTPAALSLLRSFGEDSVRAAGQLLQSVGPGIVLVEKLVALV